MLCEEPTVVIDLLPHSVEHQLTLLIAKPCIAVAVAEVVMGNRHQLGLY